jgi:shikimate dehydrogenase
MYGLLGKKLSHSRSPLIHGLIGEYPYCLFEVAPEDLDDFFAEKAFCGINVTVPYKEIVMGYCDELTETACRIGSVNTIVKRPDGSLLGHNTDYDGFLAMVSHAGVKIKGKKCLVLGSGGASKTVVTALSDLLAGQIVVISRSGEDNYKNIAKHFDGQILVNTTPVGMYPHCDDTPLLLDGFDRLEGVLDLIYNPRPTKLLTLANEKGVPAEDGLYMLVCQAISAAEYFFDRPIGYDRAEEILSEVAKTL